MSGGADADTFLYNALSDSGGSGTDRILDLIVGTDKVDVSGIDAIAGGGDDAFTWIGTSNPKFFSFRNSASSSDPSSAAVKSARVALIGIREPVP